MLEAEKGKTELEMSKSQLPLPQEEENSFSQEQGNKLSKKRKKKKIDIIQPTPIDLPNWDNLTVQTVNFIYTESEKRLKEILDACQYIQEISHRILSILLPIISLAMGFVYQKKWSDDYRVMLPVLIFICVELVAIYFLLRTIRHKSLHSLGSNPKDLLKPHLVNVDENDLQYIGFVFAACKEIQSKIDHNKPINITMSANNNWAILFATVYAPIATFVTSLLVLWWG